MPSVPVDNSQPIQQAGIPSVRFSNNQPIEAFGGGEAVLGPQRGINAVTDQVVKIGTEEKKSADQLAVLSADSKASELQTQLQVDISKMKGQDAFTAPDYLKTNWESGIKKITEGLTNDDQKIAIAKATQSRYDELNKSTQFHLRDQVQVLSDANTQGYIANSMNAAVLNYADDSRVGAERERQKAAIDSWAQTNGIPQDSEAYKSKMSGVLSATNKAVIEAWLESGNVEAAKKVFDSNKSDMIAADVLNAEKSIESGQVIKQGNDIWAKVANYKLADGKPDEAKMREAVMGDDSLNPDKKEKIWTFVKARAAEDQANKTRQDAAQDRSFLNNVLQMKKNGASISSALTSVNKFGTDDYDRAIKTEAVQKLYAPPTESDPASFINTWEKIQDGGSSKTEIDSLFQKNKLNVNDWRRLREDIYKVNSDGKDPAAKSNWERIKALADEKFGSSKVDRETFLYNLHASADGKDPAEVWKMANDSLQGAPGTGIFGSDIFQKKQWKVDVQKMDATNLAWGKVYQDIGKSEVLAIGSGALSSDPNKKTWGLNEVNSFAESVGGYDAMKPGRPVHNAIQSLISKKQRVTPANVKAVLQKYSDGKY